MILLGVALVVGCKTECDISSDCLSQGTCQVVNCVDNKCVSSMVPNCCGNGLKEDIENGKPGNKCTCPQDYGECEGKLTYTEIDPIYGNENTYEAQYLEYFCDSRQRCIKGISPDNIQQTRLVDTRDTGYFMYDVITMFNKPVNIRKDSFRFDVELKNTLDETVILPIKITKVLVKAGQDFIGEARPSDAILSHIGSIATISVPIQYQTKKIEEVKQLSYHIDFEYTIRQQSGYDADGNIKYEDKIQRKSYEHYFTEEVPFVDTGEQ